MRRGRLTCIVDVVGGLPRTERIYIRDSYARECRSEVLRVVRDRGAKRYLVLDRTVFHPLEGGQPSDRGEIVGERFSLTVKKALSSAGVVAHYGTISGEDPQPGDAVTCRLDWERRYLIMRLHTAGHILDAAVSEVFGGPVNTLGANHGPPEAHVDYAARLPSEDELGRIERIASEIVSDDLQVRVRFVVPEELESSAYNAPNLDRLPEAPVYRLVEIPGRNSIPCTGTHVARTGEVGGVRVLGATPLRGGFRLSYWVTRP